MSLLGNITELWSIPQGASFPDGVPQTVFDWWPENLKGGCQASRLAGGNTAGKPDGSTIKRDDPVIEKKFRWRIKKDSYTEDTKTCIQLTQNCKIYTVTIMLQWKYRAMSLLALAIAAPGVALSEPASMPFLSPDDSAIKQQPSEQKTFVSEFFGGVQDIRARAGVDSLKVSPTLTEVAQAHARDMVQRGYAADTSPEGLTLLDQVRVADRRSLYSEFGSAVLIVDKESAAEKVLTSLMSEQVNAENILRGSFDHTGIGVAEDKGQFYIVQLLARVDGHLETPMPVQAGGLDSLKADLNMPGAKPVSWSVSDGHGSTLMRGSGERIRDGQGNPIAGYLNVDVAMGPDVYSLRGPYIEVN